MNWQIMFGFTNSAPAGLEAYLTVAALLFVFGIVACLARNNAIGILIGVELILSAVILNFMAFWRFLEKAQGSQDGPVMTIFIIILAACEAAIALAILLNLYFNIASVEVEKASKLKG